MLDRSRKLFVCALVGCAAAAGAPEARAQAIGRAVFVPHYFPQGSVASLRVQADGTLTLDHLYPIGEWLQSIALSPSGRWLAVASGTSSTTVEPIYIFRVEPDASLTLWYSGVVPDSPLDMKWVADDLLAVTQTGLSGSTIGMYRWNPDAFSLMEINRQTSGGFNSAIAYRRGSEFLYTQSSSGNNYIDRWRINANGTLQFTAREFTGAYPLNPVISPNGLGMYAGGGISDGRNAVLAYHVSEDEGGLIPVTGMPFRSPGNSPAYPAVSGDSRYLLVGHGTDSTVRTFLIEDSGVLQSTGHTFVVQPLQGAIGRLAVMGDIAYVTDDTSAIDGVQGIYALRIGADGSLTPLAPILYTGAPRPELGIATWNPTDVCPADFNGDSTVNSTDLSAFITQWLRDVTEGSRYADFDGSRQVNSSDLSAFITAWLDAVQNGC